MVHVLLQERLKLKSGTLNKTPPEVFDSFSEGNLDSIGRVSEETLTLADLVDEQRKVISRQIHHKLHSLFEAHPWTAPDKLARELVSIVNSNASIRSKRRTIILVSNRMTTAMAPYVSCKSGCSHCCHMNTMVYEHEAIRLARVSGRTMTRLPYRPLNQVFEDGDKFNGKPCPFLSDDKCSVYDDRPLVCRTHHSLGASSEQCARNVWDNDPARPPMYDPDLIEIPYMKLNSRHDPAEPWGNLAEFFPS
jgi:Fe-S-cluster containining protein